MHSKQLYIGDSNSYMHNKQSWIEVKRQKRKVCQQ